MIDLSRMSAPDHLAEMLKSMQKADESQQVLSRLRKDRDDLKALWESGTLKCEVLYNSLLRSNEISIETRESIVKTYDDIAASYSRMLIRSIEQHHMYLEERRAPVLTRPCGFR